MLVKNVRAVVIAMEVPDSFPHPMRIKHTTLPTLAEIGSVLLRPLLM